MTSAADSKTNVLPKLCKNNCGFFGNSSLDGYCSQCYAAEKKKLNEKEQKKQDTSIEIRQEECLIDSVELSSSPVEDLSIRNPRPSKCISKNSTPKKARCPNCRKIMGILQYPCACGGYFCSNCRYSNEHQCPIDYKAAGRKILATNNPQVIADRVHNRQ